MKKEVLKLIAVVTEKSILDSLDSTCFFLSYQPQIPKKVKKFLKKTKEK